MQQLVKIALIEPQIGYLDVMDTAEFPLTISAQEIRDITQKKGTFSKTIQLAGTKNNNILLNNYWDVNIQAGTFNINRTQKCQVILNGQSLLEEAVIQLVAIKKRSNNVSQKTYIEYSVLIKDSKADLFTNIGQKELTDIKFDHLNHTLNAANIISTLNNTVEDEYKYYFHYQENNTYNVSDVKLGIFEKAYIDRIIGGAGFSWVWDGYSANTAMADRTIVPCTVDKITKPTNETLVLASSTGSTTYNFPYNATNADRVKLTATVEDQDLSGLYTPSSSTYTNIYYLNSSQPITFKLGFTYQYYLVNNNAQAVTLQDGSANYAGVTSLHKNGNFNSYITQANTFPAPVNQNPFAPNILVASGTTIAASGTTLIGSGTTSNILFATANGSLPNEFFNYGIWGRKFNNFSQYNGEWKFTGGTIANNVDVRIVLRDVMVEISTPVDALTFNSLVDVNDYVPKKFKQSDFLKQFLTRYNLMVELNPDNPTELIFTPRDEWYDNGNTQDWTKLICKDKDIDISPASASYKKKKIYTWKQDDSDILMKGYKDNVNEIYGQLEYTFDSDHLKDVDTTELSVSPVVVGRNVEGNVLPFLYGQGPAMNTKIALNAMQQTSNNPITVVNYPNNSQTTNIVPLISHLDKPENASFDLNFGINDYYFYNSIGSFTNNNLFNLYHRRTANQIDKGWIMTAYFKLSGTRIRQTKLNDKIQIGNTYWNINQITDFKANKKEFTKVELISIDDNLDLPNFRVRIPVLPAAPSVVAPNPIRDFGVASQASGNVVLSTNPVITQGTGNVIGQGVKGGIVRGNGNVLNSDAFVLGDNNVNNGTKSMIMGSNNVVAENTDNVFIFGDDITGTTSNTLYVKNIEAETINGIDVDTLTATTSGDFCALSGINTNLITSCTNPYNRIRMAVGGSQSMFIEAFDSSGFGSYVNLDDDAAGLFISLPSGIQSQVTVGTESIVQSNDAVNNNILLMEPSNGYIKTDDFDNSKFMQMAFNPSGYTFGDEITSELLIIDNNGVKPFIATGTAQTALFVNSNGYITTGSTALSSGLYSGGTLSINPSDNTKFDISAGAGIILDFWTTLGTIITNRFTFPAQTGLTVTNLSSATQTYVTIDMNGNVGQYTTTPSNTVRRDNIIIGQLGHSNLTNIGGVTQMTTSYDNPIEVARDVINEFKFINTDNIVSANGANLSINKSDGFLFGQGLNYSNDVRNPNKIATSAQTAASFRYRTQTGGTSSAVTVINPAVYDVSGTITSISGSANRATNQRVYLAPNGNIIIQYGQEVYDNLTEAISGLQFENFVEYVNVAENSILIGIITVTKGCTALNNTTDARFLAVSRFGETLGAAAGISTTTLQQAYNNSVSPEITTNSTLGALSIKNGAGADTLSAFEVLNSGGTITSSIKADGNVSFSGTVSANRLQANVFTGTSIANLGVDASGFIVSASTSSNKYATTISLTAGNNTITHNLGDTDVIVQVRDGSGIVFIPNSIDTFASNSLNINIVGPTVTNARVVVMK